MEFNEFKERLKVAYELLPYNEVLPCDEILKKVSKENREYIINSTKEYARVFGEVDEYKNSNTCSYEKPDTATDSIDGTLAERGNNYGQFEDFSELAQNLKHTFYSTVHDKGHPELFTDAMNEAIEMCFHKLARIGTGNPLFIDSARDLVGYAKLLLNEIKAQEGATDIELKTVKRKK